MSCKKAAFFAAAIVLSFSPILTGCGTAQAKPNDTSTPGSTVGPAGPTGPAGATGPTGATGPQGPPGQDQTSFLAGRHFFVLGDSISSITTSGKEWQKVVTKRTGLLPTYTDAWPGRHLSEAFACYGAANPGDPLTTYSTSIRPECTADGGKDGATLAENLAGSDLAIIELGTNDEGKPSGKLGMRPTRELRKARCDGSWRRSRLQTRRSVWSS